jgi:hypothetical protein
VDGLLILVLFGLIIGVAAASIRRRLVSAARTFYRGDEKIEGDEPVGIMSFNGELAAEVARGKLESQGIGSYIINTNSLAAYGSTPLANWELRVRYRDVDAARALLAESGDS